MVAPLISSWEKVGRVGAWVGGRFYPDTCTHTCAAALVRCCILLWGQFEKSPSNLFYKCQVFWLHTVVMHKLLLGSAPTHTSALSSGPPSNDTTISNLSVTISSVICLDIWIIPLPFLFYCCKIIVEQMKPALINEPSPSGKVWPFSPMHCIAMSPVWNIPKESERRGWTAFAELNRNLAPADLS